MSKRLDRFKAAQVYEILDTEAPEESLVSDLDSTWQKAERVLAQEISSEEDNAWNQFEEDKLWAPHEAKQQVLNRDWHDEYQQFLMDEDDFPVEKDEVKRARRSLGRKTSFEDRPSELSDFQERNPHHPHRIMGLFELRPKKELDVPRENRYSAFTVSISDRARNSLIIFEDNGAQQGELYTAGNKGPEFYRAVTCIAEDTNNEENPEVVEPFVEMLVKGLYRPEAGIVLEMAGDGDSVKAIGHAYNFLNARGLHNSYLPRVASFIGLNDVCCEDLNPESDQKPHAGLGLSELEILENRINSGTAITDGDIEAVIELGDDPQKGLLNRGYDLADEEAVPAMSTQEGIERVN